MIETKKHWEQYAILLFLALLLQGCELMGPEMGHKLPLNAEPLLVEDDPSEIVFKQLDNDPKDSQSTGPQTELYPGTGHFVSTRNQQKKSPPRSSNGKYTLNFDGADLGEVTKVILSDTLGENYVLSPKVTGTVTLQTTRPLTKEELLPTLEMLLKMNNAALVRDGVVYHIEPIADALKGSPLQLGKQTGKLPSGYQTRVIPLEFVGVQDMVEILTPLLTDKSILRVDESRNLLLVAGTGQELRQMLDVVNTFDVDFMKGMSFGLFPLTHVDTETMIYELENILADPDKSPLTGMLRFLAIERLNAVMVITPQSHYLTRVQSWIYRLDRANLAAGGGVIVYRVQNVDAEELAETLNAIFQGSGKKDKKPSIAPGLKAATIRSTKDGEAATTKKTGEGSTPKRLDVADLADVNVIADITNNALVIVATPQQYEAIRPVIKQLDVMPLQVLIDAMIVEVSLDGDLKYGVEWFIQSGNFTGILSKVSEGDVGGFGPLTGFSLAYTGSDIRAILNALETQSEINVVATPSLMVLNNQEASINVGDQVPIATSQSTNTSSVTTDTPIIGDPSTSAIVTNQIQMVDTGVTLNVKPRVNAGGLVIMEIEQEANEAVITTTSTLNSPTIQQRKINSSIAVKDGETIVLGGLIREKNEVAQNGIPYLSTLPVIGPLFGSTQKIKEKTELVILITPRVIENRQDARKITNEFKRKLTGIYEDSEYLDDLSPEMMEVVQ